MLGIITALPIEARTVSPKYRRIKEIIELTDRNILLSASGIGANNAEVAARRMVSQKVTGLMSWGTAAGIDPTLQAGALVLPDKFCILENDTVVISSKLISQPWREQLVNKLLPELDIKTGLLAHADEILSSPESKKALFLKTKAIAADMESYAIAKIASAHNIPFVVIRVVVDPATVTLPNALLKVTNKNGEINKLKLMTAILSHPKELCGLIQLGKAFSKAKRTLKIVARINVARE